MRVFVILILAVASFSCSTINNYDHRYNVNFSNLQDIIAEPNFNQNSKWTVSSVEYCKVEFKARWSKAVAKRKGFYAKFTTTVVDFSNNYQNSKFVPAHDVIEDGVVQQRWSDLIEINFAKETEVKRLSLENEGDDIFIASYLTDYISIGVSNPENQPNIKSLLMALDSMYQSCKS